MRVHIGPLKTEPWPGGPGPAAKDIRKNMHRESTARFGGLQLPILSNEFLMPPTVQALQAATEPHLFFPVHEQTTPNLGRPQHYQFAHFPSPSPVIESH